jgi:transcriptional regulator with XRE-family HTH domain
MNQLRYWRLARGLSQDRLAERIGCSKTAISQYENGVYKPPIPMCITLAQALSIDPGILLQDFHGVNLPHSRVRRGARQVKSTPPVAQTNRVRKKARPMNEPEEVAP